MNATKENNNQTNDRQPQNPAGNVNAQQVSRNPEQQPNLMNATILNSLDGNILSLLQQPQHQQQQQQMQNQNTSGLNVLGSNILSLQPRQQQQQQLAQNQNASGLNILGSNILSLLSQQNQVLQQPAQNQTAFSLLVLQQEQQQQQAQNQNVLGSNLLGSLNLLPQQQQQQQNLLNATIMNRLGSSSGGLNNLSSQQAPNQMMLMMLQLSQQPPAPANNVSNQLAAQLASLQQQQQQMNGLAQFNVSQSLAHASPNGMAMAQALTAVRQRNNQLLLGLRGNVNMGLGGSMPSVNNLPNPVLSSAATASANAALNPSQDEVSRLLAGGAAQGDGTLDADPVWDNQFKALQRYRLVHGHTKVPSRHPRLGHWVVTQRRQMALNQQGLPNGLTAERIAMLNAIGFSWNVLPEARSTWEQKLEELDEYKKTFGNTLVPQRYKANPQLGTWVHTQRRQWKLMKEGKKTSMTQKKIDTLNDIGFVWIARTNDNKSDYDKEDTDAENSLSGGAKDASIPMKAEETPDEQREDKRAKSDRGQAASTPLKSEEMDEDREDGRAKSGDGLGTASTSVKTEDADEDDDNENMTTKSGDGQVTYPGKVWEDSRYGYL